MTVAKTPTARFGRGMGFRFAPLALALTLAALGCTKGGAGGPGGFRPPPMPVETALVVQEKVSDRFEAVGSIEASEAITVVSEIDGVVVRLPFREGSAVRRGGIIAQLDDAQVRAEVNRTEALRDQAKSTFNRVKSVVDQGAGAPQDLDDAGASLKVADANLALARSRLSKTRITAPFSGVLGARRVSPGAFIRGGQAITDLAKLDELRVNFSAPERYLGQLNRGAEVDITTTAYPGYAIKGRIDVVDPVLDPGTRSARIVARVRNPGGRFRPGMSANVSAVLGQRQKALTIPSEAIFAEGDQSFAYVVKPDSTVTRTALTLGTRLTDVVEVVQGLSPGMTVVRTGHQKLFEGAKVAPVHSQPGGGKPGAAGAAP
jgi:membrane fusion protein (multidrug efflux system)